MLIEHIVKEIVFGLFGDIQIFDQARKIRILDFGQLVNEFLDLEDLIIGMAAHGLNLPFLAFIFL